MNSHQYVRCIIIRCGVAVRRVASVISTSGDSRSFHAFSWRLEDKRDNEAISLKKKIPLQLTRYD